MDTQTYKEKLEREAEVLIGELKTVGRINPDNPSDWEAVSVDPEDVQDNRSDPNDSADNIEQYEENTAILKQLETRFNDVKSALTKIKEGRYGTCEIGGEQIEKERLDADPAARTCMNHMEK
jgi:RNA polymerase-binding transcription factor DksA